MGKQIWFDSQSLFISMFSVIPTWHTPSSQDNTEFQAGKRLDIVFLLIGARKLQNFYMIRFSNNPVGRQLFLSHMVEFILVGYVFILMNVRQLIEVDPCFTALPGCPQSQCFSTGLCSLQERDGDLYPFFKNSACPLEYCGS